MTGEEDVVDHAREALRLGGDDSDQALDAVLAENIGPPKRLGCAVDRRERRAQLVRGGRDEVVLELVHRALVGAVLERVDGRIGDVDAAEREPDLAPGDLEGEHARESARRAARAGDGDRRGDLLPAAEQLVGRPADRLLVPDPGDLLGSEVPELHDPVAVDHEDTVPDVLEHVRLTLELQPLHFDAPREPAPLDRAGERGSEVVAVDRLLDVVVRAPAQSLDGEVVLAVTGDQDRRRVRPHALDLVQQREPVHPGHLDVGDDRVVVLVGDLPERVPGRVAGLDCELGQAQAERLGQRLQQSRVVVDDQDPGLVTPRPPRLPAAARS